MTERDDTPRAVFARLDTLCGCTRFVLIASVDLKSISIPVVTRGGIVERKFLRDFDADSEFGESGGAWKLGDVLVLAYREDA